MKLEIDPAKNPNAVGELLRSLFFTDDGYGCYDNFKLRENVIKYPDIRMYFYQDQAEYNETCGELYTRAKLLLLPTDNFPIEMRYHWDGDGTLVFYTFDGVLVNDDCKKDHTWRFYPIDTLPPRHTEYEFWDFQQGVTNG